jgi:predicted phosphodiesterase
LNAGKQFIKNEEKKMWHRRRIRWFGLWLGIALLWSHADAIEPPKPPENEFTFVVLGDSQFNNVHVFNRLVEEVTLLYPSFVIQVGDLIDGYVDDIDEVKKQWRRFKGQLAPLADIPYFPVPGNHDVLGKDAKPNAEVEAVYHEIWGDFYYSFDYRNAHFVILDTDYRDEIGRVGSEQFRWLEQDLNANHNKAHIFVFFHRPLDSLKNSDQLHQLFTQHPVRAVFYGHAHHYHYFERDGIQYVMTNASGNMGTNIPQAGSFFHFIFASVRDGKFRFGVVKAGSVLPPTVAWPEDNAGLFGLKRKALAIKEISATELVKTAQGYDVTLKLSNPTSQEVWAQLQWNLPDGRWRVLPNRASRVILNAGTTEQEIRFTFVRTDGSLPEGWPSCRVSIPYLTKNGEWVTTTHDFKIK